MGKVCLWTVLLSVVLVFGAMAQEKRAEFSEVDMGKNVKVIQGRLSDYAQDFVSVQGHKLELCKDYTVFDDLDHPISLSGLSATETVRVTFVESCATEVRVVQVKK